MTTTSKTRAVVVLGAAFLLGLVAGGAAMQVMDKSGGRPGNRRDCDVRHQRVCYWAGELQLTTEQQESMLNVYRDGEARMDSLQKTIRPAMDSLFQAIRPGVDSQRHAIRDMIRPLLTPEQREKYDSVNTAMDEQRRQGRERTNGGPGGPGGSPRERQ